jgi:O-antigen ligase
METVTVSRQRQAAPALSMMRLTVISQLAVPLCFGLAAWVLIAVAFAPGVNPEKMSRLAFIAIAIVLVLVAGAITRQFRRAMIFGWVLSQSYFRTFSPAGDPVSLTSFDPYLTVSDFFLLALLGVAVWERVFLMQKRTPRGPAMWLWALPFFLTALLSTANAERFDWAAFEIFRLAKLLLVLILLRRLIRSSFDWWLAIAALATSGCLQALFGLFQLATHTAITLAGESAPRALGSMGHPNTFSSYLELIWPVCGILALTPGAPKRRWPAAAASVLMLVGIAVAQSRAVWIVAAGQTMLLLAGAAGLRLVPVKRALGLAIVFFVTGSLTLAPFAPQIERRLFSNLRESVEFRDAFDALALRMYLDRPWIGGGPRQFPLRFAPHARELYGSLADKVPPFPVHNFYLLEMVEYGPFGLGAFLAFIVAVYVYAARRLRSPPAVRAATFGICVGIAGILVHQLSELVLILDPNLYTFGTMVALLAALPVLRERISPSPAHTPAAAPVQAAPYSAPAR